MHTTYIHTSELQPKQLLILMQSICLEYGKQLRLFTLYRLTVMQFSVQCWTSELDGSNIDVYDPPVSEAIKHLEQVALTSNYNFNLSVYNLYH